MSWLKHVIIDLAVTLLIALTTTGALPAWTEWIIYVYTPFMLVLKATAYFGNLAALSPKQAGDQPPPWFYHVLYAVNCGMLLYSQWWITGAQWVLIWGFSALIARKR